MRILSFFVARGSQGSPFGSAAVASWLGLAEDADCSIRRAMVGTLLADRDSSGGATVTSLDVSIGFSVEGMIGSDIIPVSFVIGGIVSC